MWKVAPKWLWLAVIVGSLTGWLFPFTFQRQEPWGELFREERRGLALSPRERIYQLNTDQFHDWIPLIKDFPFFYSREHYREGVGTAVVRINRPVYPGSVSALCRLSQGFQSLIRANPQSAKIGCEYAQAMASGAVLNWVLFVWSAVAFYRLLLAWNVGARIATLSATHYAMSPFILFHLLDVSSNLIAFPIAVATLWIFTRLAQRHADTGWVSQPLIYGLGLGALMLGRAQYDVVCVGWFALSYLRRWGAMFISFASHLVPLLAWIGLITLFGLRYYDPQYYEGIWLFREFFYWPLWDQFHRVAEHTVVYELDLLAAFSPVTLFFVIFGLRRLIAENMWKALALVCLSLFINWLFTLAIQREYSVLYVGELFFVIYPVASLGVTTVVRRFSARIQRLVMVLYLASSVGLQWAFMYLDTHLDYMQGALSVDIMAMIRSLWTARVELLSNLILMSAVMVLLMSWRRSGRNGVLVGREQARAIIAERQNTFPD
jgi:hypothetical protein